MIFSSAIDAHAGAFQRGSAKRLIEYTKSCATSSRGLPPKAGSSWKKMPGRMRIVQVRKSSDDCGMPSATPGTILNGRARWSYVYRPSKMCAVRTRE